MAKVPLTFGPSDVTVERRADGAMIVRSPHPLGPYPKAMTDWLDHWARAAPTVCSSPSGRAAPGAG